MNKKSMEGGMVPILMTLVVVALVGFILLKFFGKSSGEAGTFFSSETLKAKDSKCKFDMQRALEEGRTKPTDTDNDGRPDACDVCVNGNNDEDYDLDGMPKDCDKDDNDRTVVVCGSKLTITKDGRCIV